MGQKTHPYGFRLAYNKTWHSRWYAQGKEYAKLLHSDLALREGLKRRLGHAGVAAIDIERAADKLRDDLAKMTGRAVHINIQEIQRPELEAQLVAESIAGQLERRVSFRRAMKKAMESAFRFGGKGVKIMVAGRLGGSEIARTEWYQEGRLPLHTLKADIDFGFAEARTTYGVIGVKVWVYKGDLLKEKGRRATA